MGTTPKVAEASNLGWAKTSSTPMTDNRWNATGSAGVAINNNLDGGTISGTIYSVNNNNNVEYNSMLVHVSAFLDEFYNRALAADTIGGITKEEFLDQIHYGINTSESEIQTGWNATKNGGDVDLSHAPFGYDHFTGSSDSSNPDQKMSALGYSMPWQFADWDHNGIYDPAAGDGQILGNVSSYNIHTGTPTVGGSIDGSANFAVIPEPGTMILMGLGGLVLALRNKKRKNSE